VTAICSQVDARLGGLATAHLKVSSSVIRVRATGFFGRRRRVAEAVISKTGAALKTLFYREE
jgi:hypothetical protein